MPAQMAEMRREMAEMHNFVHVMASTSARPIAGHSTAAPQPIAGPSIAATQPIAGPSTAAAQPIAGPSTSGAHPLAAPSTAAAQPIAALSTGVGIVGERPNNMASFSSVPLGSLVDPKIKAKLWTGQFVELYSLVGEFSESPVLIFDVNNRNPSVQMRDNVSRRTFNVGQWTDAFLVYVSIYIECHPTEVASILKYGQLVRSMAASARNNMCIAYDRDFRKLRAHNNMPWDVIHQELYLALSHRNQNVSHNPRPIAINEPSMNQQSIKVAATMLDVAKTKRVEAMQRLQKINETQKVIESKKMKLLEKAIPSQEATKTKAGASGNSERGVTRKKAK